MRSACNLPGRLVGHEPERNRSFGRSAYTGERCGRGPTALRRTARFFLPFLLGAALLQWSSLSVQACAACFGKSDSNMAQGMNMGIFALLLVITSVLCGIAGFFVYVARRSAHLEDLAAVPGKNLSQPQTNA